LNDTFCPYVYGAIIPNSLGSFPASIFRVQGIQVFFFTLKAEAASISKTKVNPKIIESEIKPS
jgi:hypothetical protein